MVSGYRLGVTRQTVSLKGHHAMTTKSLLLRRNQERNKWVYEKSLLESHAATTRDEIQQLRVALRITQERIRHLNRKIEASQIGHSHLTLVHNRDRDRSAS